jgi:hypothetical protein
MGVSGFVGRAKGLVNLHNSPIHGDLLNDLTGDIDIILGQE